MTDTQEFIEAFLEHAYDPVKAHEYYMRTRQLKGKASAAEKAGAKTYEQHQTADAQKQLNADIKGKPVVLSKVRRIGKAEQKLIRARSLAMRVKDPTVKADMLARLKVAENKLRKIKGTIDLINPPKKTVPPQHKASHKPPPPHKKSVLKKASSVHKNPLADRKNVPPGSGYRGPA